jgi:hypothetical protein
MTEESQRIALAAEYLAEVSGTSVEQLPPTVLMRECAELRRLLGQVLGLLAARQDDSRRVAEIRGVLAAFDWEFHDRQLALERIERIAGGDEQ